MSLKETTKILSLREKMTMRKKKKETELKDLTIRRNTTNMIRLQKDVKNRENASTNLGIGRRSPEIDAKSL